MRKMKCVIGVDPASTRRKKTTCVQVDMRTGEVTPRMLSHAELSSKVSCWAEQDALVVWDAPLTGPANPPRFLMPWPVEKSGPQEQSYTKREIERGLKRVMNGVKGVAVMGYGCGCPHVVLTQAMFGLPRVGPYQANYEDLPLRLICQAGQLEELDPRKRGVVVETHPAVALWGWLSGRMALDKERTINGADWSYKGRSQRLFRAKVIDVLLELW